MKDRYTKADDVVILNQGVKYGGFFCIKHIKLRHRLFAGGWTVPFSRELFERGESAAVLLYDKARDCIVMIEQFRIGLIGEEDPWMTEIVAGMIEKGESPEEVARREAEEETGCRQVDLKKISRYFPSAGGSSEAIHLFCGLVDSEGIDGVHGVEGENEDIRVKKVSFDEACRMVDQGEIRDAASIIAILWLRLNKEQI